MLQFCCMNREGLRFGRLGELNIHVSSSLNYGNKQWDFRADPLPAYPNSSLSVRMCEHTSLGWRPDFYLDYHDVLGHDVARMHMYTDASRQIPFETKLQRISCWQAAILAFDSMMQDFEGPVSKQAVEQMVASGVLPRPKTVQLATDSSGLIVLLSSLNFPFDDESGEYVPEWNDLVKQAGVGSIVGNWLALKGK